MSDKTSGPRGTKGLRARIAIGGIFLLLGVVFAAVALLNLEVRISALEALDALFGVQFFVYGLVGAAYLVIGAWNLVSFRAAPKGPVVAALIMSAVGVLFGAFYVLSINGIPQLTQGVGIVLDIAVILLCWTLLRPTLPGRER